MFIVIHTQDAVDTVCFSARLGIRETFYVWKSHFHDDTDLLLNFYFPDFNHAFSPAGTYSEQLGRDAYASSSDTYKDIVSLSARQVLGATVFSSIPNSLTLFLEKISSTDDYQPVDVVFSAFPFFLRKIPRWLAYLTKPLSERLLGGRYPDNYTMPNLGSHSSYRAGHTDGNDEYMSVK
jgi:hypothetical protein